VTPNHHAQERKSNQRPGREKEKGMNVHSFNVAQKKRRAHLAAEEKSLRPLGRKKNNKPEEKKGQSVPRPEDVLGKGRESRSISRKKRTASMSI